MTSNPIVTTRTTVGAWASALCFLATVCTTHAGTYNWNNAAGGNFATGTNWTPNGSPVAADTVYLNLPNTYQVDFTANGNTTYAYLQAGGAANVTFALAGNTWTTSLLLAGYGVSNNSFTVTGGTLAAGGHFALGAGAAGGSNSMTVSGGAAVLKTNGYDLGVGYYIDGGNWTSNNTLTASGGGVVNCARTLFIGTSTTAGNQLTVTGSGSQATATSNIAIAGTGGNNKLLVQSGGSVTTPNLSLGGTGNSATFDGATLAVSGVVSTAGANNAFTATNGATVTGSNEVQFANGSGVTGDTLTVSGGATVTGGAHLRLGYGGASGNTVTVTGTSSLLKANSFDVGIGNYAGYTTSTADNTSVTVSAGGELRAGRTIFIGAGATTGDQVTVTGATSKATAVSSIEVGGTGGSNRLYVQSGATATAPNVYLRGTSNSILADSTGKVTSTGSLTTVGSSNTLTARDTGSSISAGTLGVGYDSTAVSNSLSVENGATVTGTGHLIIGYNGASGTTATVTGGSSLLKADSYDIGIGNYNGQATNTANSTSVTVSAGGELRAQRDLFIGAGATSGNQVTVTGTNSKAKAISTSITVGGTGGSNRLTVQSGGLADAPTVNLNGTSNSIAVDNGALTGTNLYTRGTGNTMAVSNGGAVTFGQIRVGEGGSAGTFDVTGGTVTAGHFYVGTSGGTGYNVNVTGPAALVKTNSYDFHIGYAGTNNIMTVSGGGQAIGVRLAYIGETNTATGNRLIITGAGSQFTNGTNNWSDHIYVGTGTAGNNQIEVSSGGVLDCFSVIVGAAAGNAVTNTGGTYQFRMLAPTLTPGAGGIGVTGGTISYRNIADVNVNSNVTGTLANITFAGNNTFMMNNSQSQGYTSQTYTYDSVANTGNPKNYQKLVMANGTTAIPGGLITIGSGGAMEVENTTGSLGQTLTNNGSVWVKSGASLAITGTLNQGATGTTTVDGTLSLTGALNLTGGRLGGSGTVTDSSGMTVQTAGIVAPGSSVGTLSVTGPVTFGSGGDFLAELDFSGHSDLLAVTGGLTLNSGSRLDLSLLNGGLQGTYTLATWTGTRTGTFANVYLEGILQGNPTVQGGIDGKFQLIYGANGLTLVPEPTGLLLFLAASGFVTVCGRRHRVAARGTLPRQD